MQVKFNYNKKPIETYCSFDPAIDQDKTDIKKYMETRDNSLLVFKPDSKPTKFYIKPIPRAIFLNAVAGAPGHMQGILSFQYGIDRIDNLKEVFLNEGVEVVNNGLQVWEPSEVISLNDGSKLKYIDKEELEAAFNLSVIMEIGSMILKKTNCVPGIKATYPVLPTSIEIIEAMKS